MSDRLLTVEETAERLALSRTTLYALFRSGELPSVTIRRTRRVPESAVDSFIEQHVADGAS